MTPTMKESRPAALAPSIMNTVSSSGSRNCSSRILSVALFMSSASSSFMTVRTVPPFSPVCLRPPFPFSSQTETILSSCSPLSSRMTLSALRA